MGQSTGTGRPMHTTARSVALRCEADAAFSCRCRQTFLVLEWHWIDYPGWNDPTFQDKRGISLDVNDEAARHYVRPGTELFGERP